MSHETTQAITYIILVVPVLDKRAIFQNTGKVLLTFETTCNYKISEYALCVLVGIQCTLTIGFLQVEADP